jgi:hypothetical protein
VVVVLVVVVVEVVVVVGGIEGEVVGVTGVGRGVDDEPESTTNALFEGAGADVGRGSDPTGATAVLVLLADCSEATGRDGATTVPPGAREPGGDESGSVAAWREWPPPPLPATCTS